MPSRIAGGALSGPRLFPLEVMLQVSPEGANYSLWLHRHDNLCSTELLTDVFEA